MAITVVTADVTSRGKTLLLQAVGESPQTQHEIFNNGSIVLGKTRKHWPSSKEWTNPNVFFRFSWLSSTGHAQEWLARHSGRPHRLIR